MSHIQTAGGLTNGFMTAWLVFSWLIALLSMVFFHTLCQFIHVMNEPADRVVKYQYMQFYPEIEYVKFTIIHRTCTRIFFTTNGSEKINSLLKPTQKSCNKSQNGYYRLTRLHSFKFGRMCFGRTKLISLFYSVYDARKILYSLLSDIKRRACTCSGI